MNEAHAEVAGAIVHVFTVVAEAKDYGHFRHTFPHGLSITFF
jgi:hypothetical protein